MKFTKKLFFIFILFVFANKIFADDYSSVQQNINLQYQQQQRDIELKARQTPIADEEQKALLMALLLIQICLHTKSLGSSSKIKNVMMNEFKLIKKN